MDVVRCDLADLDHLFHFHDADLAGRGGGRVEVARRQAELQVAALVGPVGLDQGDIGHERALHHIGLAVEFAQLLALGHHGAHAGLGEEGGNAGATGTQLLGQRALGREFQLQLAGRSEEHTSELQSPCNLVCRLLLEKKKNCTVTTPSRVTLRCLSCSHCAPSRYASRAAGGSALSPASCALTRPRSSSLALKVITAVS